jgi:hypothetical protein
MPTQTVEKASFDAEGVISVSIETIVTDGNDAFVSRSIRRGTYAPGTDTALLPAFAVSQANAVWTTAVVENYKYRFGTPEPLNEL